MGLGLNQCSNNHQKPLPRSRIGYPMCFLGGFGDFFIFLFSDCLRLDHRGLTAINEVNPLGLRRQQMENCEGRENSITLFLPELFHWHLRTL
jgi:hypothetical protein